MFVIHVVKIIHFIGPGRSGGVTGFFVILHIPHPLFLAHAGCFKPVGQSFTLTYPIKSNFENTKKPARPLNRTGTFYLIDFTLL